MRLPTRRGSTQSRLIRLPEVKRKTGLGSTAIYKFQKDGGFPKSIKITPRAVAWIEREVDEWIEKRITKRDVQAMREQEEAALCDE
jgi:prophage regulatory protein